MRGLITYPDATVVCGEPLYHDVKANVLVNPTVILEVLPPPLEDYETSEKRLRYPTIPSLAEYVLVSQDEPSVEHWVRKPRGNWGVSALAGLHATVGLSSIGCSLALADIYDRLIFH